MNLSSNLALNIHPLRSTAMKVVLLCVAFSVVCSVGCSKKKQPRPKEDLASKSVSDVLAVALENTEEVDFCVEEKADSDSLSQPVAKLKEIIGLLPNTIANSSLSEGQKAKLTTSIAKLTTSCDSLATAIESSGASDSKIMKANKEVAKQIKAMQKLAK